MELDSARSWMTALAQAQSNTEYKQSLEAFPFVKSINELIKSVEQDKLVDLQQIHDIVKQSYIAAREEDKKVSDDHDDESFFWNIINALNLAYQRENCLGPSIYTQYVEETRAPLITSGPLPTNNLDAISTKNTQLQKILMKHFERDGEGIYHLTQLLILLYSLETLITEGEKDSSSSSSSSSFTGKQDSQLIWLWQARLSFCIDLHLSSSVVHLKDASVKLYKKYTDSAREEFNKIPFGMEKAKARDNLALLLAEQSYCFLHFYKYDKTEQAIQEALDLVNLKLDLTGRLGKRTKYQENDIAQLTLDFESKSTNLVISEESKTESEQQAISQSVQLEEDTILYENGPKFTDQIQQRQLTVVDQVIINAHTNYLFRTMPKDEIKEEHLRPFVTALCKDAQNWLVFSKSLLLRSRNETERTKTMERSLAQVNQLSDQFRDQQPELRVKAEFLESINYPFRWNLIRELGELFMSVGVFMSAHDLFIQVELWEEAIKCLFMAGRPTPAQELADKCLSEGTDNYNILCLLGDIKQDESYYDKAWEQSKHRCARAMRSKARVMFFKQEFQKSIDCYHLAFAINRLFPDCWFTCGCAHMKINQYDQAIFAFGNTISMDERNQEAWANIANCYMAQGKHKEALACTEQALKFSRNAWKIWYNQIRFSLLTKNFYKAVHAVKELFRQNKTDDLNSTLFLKISEVWLEKYATRDQDSEEPMISKEDFLRHKAMLYQFYDFLLDKKNDYQIWRLVGRIKAILREPSTMIKDLKVKELKSLMKPNWNIQLQICELVERGISELVNIFQKAKLEMSNGERLFIRNSVLAIEDSLKRKFEPIEDLVDQLNDDNFPGSKWEKPQADEE